MKKIERKIGKNVTKNGNFKLGLKRLCHHYKTTEVNAGKAVQQQSDNRRN